MLCRQGCSQKRMSGRQEVAQAGCLSFWRGFIQAGLQWKRPAAAPGAWLAFIHVSVLPAGHGAMAPLKL